MADDRDPGMRPRDDRAARIIVGALCLFAAGYLAWSMARSGPVAEPEYPRLVTEEQASVELLPPMSWVNTTTTTVALTSTTAAPVSDTEGQIIAAFSRFGAGVAAQAVAVAECESVGLNPRATGAEGERGLFQIHPAYHQERIARLGFTWDRMYEVGPNIAVAVDLYEEKGWQPWSCKP